MSNFKIGDSVVHLSHGVGVITKRETREFGPDNKAEFYIMQVKDGNAIKNIFVPVEAAKERLRAVSSAKTLNEVIRILEDKTAPLNIDHRTWNRRYREYMEKIHSGGIIQIAEIIQALRILRTEKDLSFGECKLLEQAVYLLETEFKAAGRDLKVIL